MQRDKQTVLFAGGGTLGPVTPLLAVVQAWREMDPDLNPIWAGTAQGPEQALIADEHIPFYIIPTFRLARHISPEWILLPFRMMSACWAAYRLLKQHRPAVICAAGGYTSVPLIWVGWLLGIPSWIHQQDVEPLLTNNLVSPLATLITTAFGRSTGDFPSEKVRFVGNPVRTSMLQGSKERAAQRFGLDPAKKTLLVFGGGGGAKWINVCMQRIAEEVLPSLNIIHVTGRGKRINVPYPTYELLVGDEMADAFAAADIVISRAGMGALTELAALSKATIVIPLPKSPQELNAGLIEQMGAGVVIHQRQGHAAVAQSVQELVLDDDLRTRYGMKMHETIQTNVAKDVIREIKKIM